MWVDASRIAEEKYHLSTHAKIGTVAMGGYSALLAAPALAVAAPAIAAEGSAATYVYGGHAVRTAWANPWVQATGKTAFVAMAAGTGYGVATDEGFRADYVAMEMSSPVPGEGTVMGARGLMMIGGDIRSGGAALINRGWFSPSNWEFPMGQVNMGAPLPRFTGNNNILTLIRSPGKYDNPVPLSSVEEALDTVRRAFPDAVELPAAVPGIPYPSPPPGVKKWFQIHPAEPGTHELPHVKYADWTRGKRGNGGSSGHIFFTD